MNAPGNNDVENTAFVAYANEVEAARTHAGKVRKNRNLLVLTSLAYAVYVWSSLGPNQSKQAVYFAGLTLWLIGLWLLWCVYK